ncbi:MAG TPA: S-layer protein, partial [Planctomycetaceae bacterium]|nr:S-layer protein [Planctomycetaceae bacterium]
VQAYYGWIRDQVADNLPWDKLVYELVTASGSTFENGAANFYALHQSPEEMAETVSQAFMGLSINCAKCHNHPLEKW